MVDGLWVCHEWVYVYIYVYVYIVNVSGLDEWNDMVLVSMYMYMDFVGVGLCSLTPPLNRDPIEIFVG